MVHYIYQPCGILKRMVLNRLACLIGKPGLQAELGYWLGSVRRPSYEWSQKGSQYCALSVSVMHAGKRSAQLSHVDVYS